MHVPLISVHFLSILFNGYLPGTRPDIRKSLDIGDALSCQGMKKNQPNGKTFVCRARVECIKAIPGIFGIPFEVNSDERDKLSGNQGRDAFEA
jgi:hypothetical protein